MSDFDVKSIREANTAPAKPGDIILFYDQEYWSEERTNPEATRLYLKEGVTYKPIEGARPKILGSDGGPFCVSPIGPGAVVEDMDLSGGNAVVYSTQHPLTLRRCRLHHAKWAVSGWGPVNDVTVDDCDIFSVQMGVVALTPGKDGKDEHYRWTITRNRLRDILRQSYGDISGIGGQNFNDCLIEGNIIERSDDNGIDPMSWVEGTRMDGNKIRHNLIIDCKGKGIVFGGGPLGFIHNNEITSNTLLRTGGIKLNGNGEKDNYCVNNKLYDGEIIDAQRKAWKIFT